ncbi:uncharacterized protein LOC107269331 [Cephus cinctus]|uniref:Uncharacterized protein LOC107269331 n=1 Tax=Cephus cinctus TaxID=211228 RepID=A0AAJ7BZT8_CEPCN|nr:uncharacterized protein LOC107269331 [Cephus cinctus]
MELCAQNRLDEPYYEITNISGPSHAPVFTITCTIQMFQEEACARSKKQAKQNVAQKMLKHLKDNVNINLPGMELISARANDKDVDDLSKGIEYLNLSVTNLKESRKEQTDLAMARYPDLMKRPGIVSCKTHDIPISMYHLCFKVGYLNLVETLTCLLSRQKSDNMTYDELRVYLTRSADILKCEIKEINYKLKTPNLYMIGIQLSFTPQIMEIGYSTTQKEAEKNAMIAVIGTLFLLLK